MEKSFLLSKGEKNPKFTNRRYHHFSFLNLAINHSRGRVTGAARPIGVQAVYRIEGDEGLSEVKKFIIAYLAF